MVRTPAAVKEIFLNALDKTTPQERATYLAAACEGDEAIRREVEVLLAANDQPDSRLDQPAHIARPSLDATSLPDNSTRIGTMVGPYKLHEQIGEGGMGLVFMAEQQRPVRRVVALKVVKPGMDSKQIIARFEAERQALAMMDHPNIARVLDAGTTEAGRPYFIMELVRGIPINEFCDQKRLTVRQRLALFVQVCQAVQHAHQKGIIHRDLKPTNVLVTMHDTVAVPKVIDFGIAKALGPQLIDHTLLTGFAQMIGTPLYMSPEQAEMNQIGVDTRSDVYSLGVMLYELLSGATPFDKETLTKAGLDEMRRIIREQEPPRPSARLSTLQAQALSTVSDRRSTDPRQISSILRGELDWIVMKALEKDRSERYESASSLAADIERYLQGELVQACPPSAAYRLRKFAKKHGAALTTATLLAASLLLGTGISVWQAVRATAAKNQARKNEAVALAATEAEAEQRKRAELSEMDARRNLATAIEAVDSLMRRIADWHMSGVHSQLRPIRTSILKEAAGFYEQMLKESPNQPDILHRSAKLSSVSGTYVDDENRQEAHDKAVNILQHLVQEYPNRSEFRESLAIALLKSAAYSKNSATPQDLPKSLDLFRQASEIFGELAATGRKTTHINPIEGSFADHQVTALLQIAQILNATGKRGEADKYLQKAVLISESGVSQNIQATIHRDLAFRAAKESPEEADTLLRLARTEFKQWLADSANKEGFHFQFSNQQYVGFLDRMATHLGIRHPEEAEQIWDEAIATAANLAAVFPGEFGTMELTTQHKAQHLAKLAQSVKWSDPERGAKLQNYSQELSRELTSLRNQRAAFALPQSHANPRVAQVDELLGEAIKLSYALSTEFPDNTDYKNRFAALQSVSRGDSQAAAIEPGRWETFDRMSALGQSVARVADILHATDPAAAAAKRVEAEDLLRRGYRGMKDRESELSEPGKRSLTAGVERLVNFYMGSAKGLVEEPLARELLAECQSRFGSDNVKTAATSQWLAWCLFHNQKYAEAEPHFRLGVDWHEKYAPDSWETFNRVSVLGNFLLRAASERRATDPAAAEAKLVEAEKLLLRGYQELKLQEKEIPQESKHVVTDSLKWLANYYTVTNKPDEAAKWRKELEARNSANEK